MNNKKKIILTTILILVSLIFVSLYIGTNFSTKLIAHRGGNIRGVENTEEAYLSAISYGARYLECDVQVTKDKELIIFHDDSLDDFVDKNHPLVGCEIEELTYAELKDVIISQNGYNSYILTFSRYLELCKENNAIPVIELKGDFEDDDILKVYNLIKEYKFLKTAIIISFDLDYLITLRKMDSTLRLQDVGKKGVLDELDKCIEYKIDIDIHWFYCNKKLVEYCHANGLKVNIWTVNDEALIYHFMRMGVDYITTDVKMSW